MSIELRIILLISAVVAVLYIIRKLRQSQLQLMEALYWIIVAFILLLLGVFPMAASVVAKWVGVDSPVNLVYLVMIFIVLLRCFLLSIRVSQMEDTIKDLIEQLAIRKYMEKKDSEQ